MPAFSVRPRFLLSERSSVHFSGRNAEIARRRSVRRICIFLHAAAAGAVLFAAAHYSAGGAAIVAWDLGGIFIDAVLYAILFRKTGNCLISFVPHFAGNMLGFFLVPVILG